MQRGYMPSLSTETKQEMWAGHQSWLSSSSTNEAITCQVEWPMQTVRWKRKGLVPLLVCMVIEQMQRECRCSNFSYQLINYAAGIVSLFVTCTDRRWPHGLCARFRIERSGFEPWQGTLWCVHGRDTSLLLYLSPRRCIDKSWWIFSLGVTLLWTSIPFRGE